MNAPRRRIVRPQSNGQATAQERQRQLDKLRAALARERASLARWQRRFRRAFNVIQKTECRLRRLEKQLVQLST